MKLDKEVVALALKPGLMLFNIAFASRQLSYWRGCLSWFDALHRKSEEGNMANLTSNIKCYFYKCISNLLSFRRETDSESN